MSIEHALSEDEGSVTTLLRSSIPQSTGALLLPSTVTHAVLVDINNCGNVLASPLAIDSIPPTLALLIFGGPELPKVPLESVRALAIMVHQNRFHVIQTTTSALNAAEYALALYTGMLHLSSKQHVEFVLVTKDAGLDNVVNQLYNLGRRTRRIIVGSLQAVVAACRTAEPGTDAPHAVGPHSPSSPGAAGSVSTSSSAFSGRGTSGYVSAPDSHHRTSVPGVVAPIGATRQKPIGTQAPSSGGFAPLTYSAKSLTVDTSVFSRSSLDGGMSTATESMPQDDVRSWQAHQASAASSSWADVTRLRASQNPLHVASTATTTTTTMTMPPHSSTPPPIPSPIPSPTASSSSLQPPSAAAMTVPSSEEGESSSDQEGPAGLVGQVLPLSPANALAAMTTRFYAKGYGGVAQLKADVLVTMDKLSDPFDFALQVIIELKLKPFNKKRGHFRVFPKLLLRCLATQNQALLTERNRQVAREVLTVLQNNAFGKKTINKMKSIFQMERSGALSDTPAPTVTSRMRSESREDAMPPVPLAPSADGRPPGFEAFQMNTGVNPLWTLNT